MPKLKHLFTEPSPEPVEFWEFPEGITLSEFRAITKGMPGDYKLMTSEGLIMEVLRMRPYPNRVNSGEPGLELMHLELG